MFVAIQEVSLLNWVMKPAQDWASYRPHLPAVAGEYPRSFRMTILLSM